MLRNKAVLRNVTDRYVRGGRVKMLRKERYVTYVRSLFIKVGDIEAPARVTRLDFFFNFYFPSFQPAAVPKNSCLRANIDLPDFIVMCKS